MKTLIITGLLFIQSGFLFGQKEVDSVNILIDQGVVLHDSGQFNAAIKKYDRALVLRPNDLTALVEKSITLYSLREYEKTIDLCKLAIKEHPGEEELKMLYPVYGNTLDSDGKPEDAVEVYNEGIKMFPDYNQLHYNKAVTLVGLEDYEEALKSFEASGALAPKHGSSQNAIARLQIMENNKIPALFALLRFAIIEPVGARASANFPLMENLLYGNATKKGNTITISIDDLGTLGDDTDEDGEEIEKEKVANDFSSTELLLSFAGLLAMDSKVPAEGFQIQFESICSSLKEGQEENFGFYWEHYVPYFLEISEKGLTEPFSYIVYMSSGNKKVNKWIKKNGDKIDAFYDWSSQYEWPEK